MERILLRGFIMLCFTMLCCDHSAFAGVEPYENFITGSIKKNDTLIVKDEKFKNSSFNWSEIKNISVKNILNLRVIDNQSVSKDFTCTAVLRIEYFSTPEQGSPTVTDSVSLSVNYSKSTGSVFKISDSYTFENGYYVKVTVLDINSPEFGAEIPPVLQLSNKIIIDRQYLFKPGATLSAQVSTLTVSQEPIAEDSQTSNQSFFSVMSAVAPEVNVSASGFALSWPSIPGAEEYDIEWTSADNGSEHWTSIEQMLSGSNLPDHLLNDLFRNNATRITTHQNNYLLSPAYNSDYLLVRIRQVQYQGNIRLEGSWDYKLSNNAYMIWAINWHESNKNWQYSAVYAEDGKKKETISYFDGSLRGRQTATINNSDNVAVVQENVYDQFGRQAASILPAPVKQGNGSQTLHYFKKFNIDSLGRSYGYNSFNLADCEISPGRLLADSGASRYYSNQNPFIAAKNYNRYIPDAEGYPLSVTQYTADNTGRIKIQGGVGAMFQPGQYLGGKTTKYYYGKPEQWELDRLFGNDVGYANRYLKNMVIDPNGQISVSYLNASGKTIATALTGPSPENVDALNSQPAKKMETARILRPDQFVFNSSALKLSATTTYLASVPGPATLNYSITKLINTQTAGTFQLCSNCYYDLTVNISDDCNVPVFSATEPVKIGSDTANCANTGLQTGNLTVDLPKVGEYYVSFEFQLSRDVIEKYTTTYIKKGQEHGSINTEFYFIKRYLDSLDLSSAFGDCKNCNEALGTKEVFTKQMTTTLLKLEADSAGVVSTDFQVWAGQKYDELKDNCRLLQQTCLAASPCDENERLMREDVSPGGQYAIFDADGTALEPELNVLNKYWRTEFPVATQGSTAYDSELITLEDGTISSPYDQSFNATLFIRYWKEEWAVKFLKYHPEYCKLQFCGVNTISQNWDTRVKEQINTAADIPSIPGGQNLQYQYNNGAWLLPVDPFFAAGGLGEAYHSAMQNDLNSYSQRVMALAAPGAQVKSLTQLVDYMMYCSNPAANSGTGSWNDCSPVANCRVPDKEWAFYRDKYFELKERYYKIVRDSAFCGAECTTGMPYRMNPPGVISIKDFAIARDNSEEACSSLQKQISVTYLNGKVNSPISVEIYYPGQSSAITIQFAPGDIEKKFCVRKGLPVNSIKVSSINNNSAE